jgi:transcriptional regulator with XRE-family HTH domain
MTFGEKLQALREKAGLSQSELARESGVSVWTLRSYEQGRRQPLWDVLFKLAAALGVSCEEFRGCVEGHAAKSRKSPPRAKKKAK